jgi:hypothetical protein
MPVTGGAYKELGGLGIDRSHLLVDYATWEVEIGRILV